ncbi:MAG: 4Fe-4S dicluster domain-containing protein [Pyrinomonadaceae bacterium]|nr:4Fe-4S dicluster domain-containing protein [Pyrinomonadaceae bacterium]
MKNKLWKQFIDEDERGLPVVQPNTGLSRRTFLEVIGYTTAAIALTSCKAPEQKIVPYLKQPPELTPGVASWYASTCGGCSAGCGTLVKVRDGRPIKLEGNPEHPLSKGGLCPVAHSMVFGLYDAERIQQPLIRGAKATWDEVDAQITQKLNAIKASGGKVRFLSNTLISPTSRATINDLLSKFNDAKHVIYEPISTSGIRLAHLHTHGVETLPFYRVEKAKVLVSFGADFLGTWISPTAFTRGYSEARDVNDRKQDMLRHIQFESRLSLTGANADKRVTISLTEESNALLQLAKLVASKAGGAGSLAPGIAAHEPGKLAEHIVAALEESANELVRAKGASLVLCGSNDPDKQQIVNLINQTLDNYGNTISIGPNPSQGQSRDEEMQTLLQEMKDGQVAALFILNANPAYDHFSSADVAAALSKVPLKVSLSPTLDETASIADYVCPTHHFLESWDDAEPVSGVFSLTQPTIAPLFNTRAYQESLMRWNGDNRSYYDALRTQWQKGQFATQTQFKTFDEFWDRSLHDGIYLPQKAATTSPAFRPDTLNDAISSLAASATGDGLTLALYQKVTLRDGRFGNNPWLHEIPDPITKTTWDNYACLSTQTAARLNLAEGQVVRVKKAGASIEVPVLVQPGQSDDCVAVALGYGRTKAGKIGNNIGANAFPFVELVNGTLRYHLDGITLEPTGKKVSLAKTQTQDSAEGRPLIKEYSLAEFVSGHLHEESEEQVDLWKPHDFPEHKWGMVVDLNACVGCNACVLSCQAENNIPVVGKDEVGRRREMHWMRIDRYFDERADGTTTRFQPMTCEHCDNASCETVCPVLATVHSSEGLNMQVYNRCVGTRYCANNCPFKVRRFNWFLYAHDDPVANLALNPDVTVRSRGVMEKCTLCVQRIEEGKIRARNEGRPIKDGEIQTACQQSCPANAITFGDLKDLESKVSTLRHTKRNYVLLEELNMRPGLTYLGKVNNNGERMEG